MKRLNYLCLQATREGQASHAHVHEIVRGLCRRGWNVDLFEPCYGVSMNPSPLERLWEFIKVQLRLCLGSKPDVLYIRWHFAAWPTAAWARLSRIPIVQEVNGPYDDLFIAWPSTRQFSWFFEWLLRAQLSWADSVITVTPLLANWVSEESGNPTVSVIANGVNVELFRPGAPLMLPVPDSFVVFFGALAPWQGIDTLLQAVEEPEWPRDVRLVILGDGVERPNVEAAVGKGNVLYLGTVPYAYVPGIVGRSIAGVSPQSSADGRSDTGLYPLKVFETLGCGVPGIVTDFPGQADLIREGRCGLIIPPEDPQALAQAVAYLYNHPEERNAMGKRGRAIVVSEHSWDDRADRTERVLERVLLRG